MATFNKLPCGCWRAQVRRKGQYVSCTFRLKSEAETWAMDTERAIQSGRSPYAVQIEPEAEFGVLTD